MAETDKSRSWVPGWLSEVFLIACAFAMLWSGNDQGSATFVTGALVIGAIRQIERERRAAKPEG
jgi:uncharacterized membrane protein YjjP (DUF1212 family)